MEGEKQLPPPKFMITPEGNYFIASEGSNPPTAISGNFYKLGHIVKNWKYRFIVIVGGTLSYYKTNSFAPMSLKGAINLKGYSVRKYRKRQLYLWYSHFVGEGKDLLLHIPRKESENKYSMQLWIQAIRAHIRCANESYLDSMDWYPMYEEVRNNRSLIYHRTYQVVRRDGVSVQNQFEEELATFQSFLKFHEIVEINELILNSKNDCRGRLANGDGWVTVSTNDGNIILVELLNFNEVNSADEEEIAALSFAQERREDSLISILTKPKKSIVEIPTYSSSSKAYTYSDDGEEDGEGNEDDDEEDPVATLSP